MTQIAVNWVWKLHPIENGSRKSLFIKYQIDTFIVAVFKVRKNNFRLDGLMVINVDDFIQIFLNGANRNRDRMIMQKSDEKKARKDQNLVYFWRYLSLLPCSQTLTCYPIWQQ